MDTLDKIKKQKDTLEAQQVQAQPKQAVPLEKEEEKTEIIKNETNTEQSNEHTKDQDEKKGQNEANPASSNNQEVPSKSNIDPKRFYTPQVRYMEPNEIPDQGFKLEKEVIMIGVCGGTCAGKEEFSVALKKKLETKKIVVVAEELFYKEEHSIKLPPSPSLDELDHDHPNAIDWDLFYETINTAKKTHTIGIQYVNQKAHNIVPIGSTDFLPCEVIIIHGTRIFHNERLRNLFNIKIFLDTEEDIRLGRRIYRDWKKKKIDVKVIIDRYLKFIKVDFDKYVFPSKKYADIIIPNYGGDNYDCYKKGTEPELNKTHQTLQMITDQVTRKK